MGRCMSGMPSCAFTDPSVNSTMECTIDWGCTTASMRSGVMPNSQRASIISNALLSIVAESMVILAPIDQLGWARASRTVTLLSSSMLRVRKGPPEAVISSFLLLMIPLLPYTGIWPSARNRRGLYVRVSCRVVVSQALRLQPLSLCWPGLSACRHRWHAGWGRGRCSLQWL